MSAPRSATSSVPPTRLPRTSATDGRAPPPAGPPPSSVWTCATVDATTVNGGSEDVIVIAMVSTRPSPSVLGTSDVMVVGGGVDMNVVAEVVRTAPAGKTRDPDDEVVVLVWEMLVSDVVVEMVEVVEEEVVLVLVLVLEVEVVEVDEVDAVLVVVVVVVLCEIGGGEDVHVSKSVAVGWVTKLETVKVTGVVNVDVTAICASAYTQVIRRTAYRRGS
jgi:hypothetical protein